MRLVNRRSRAPSSADTIEEPMRIRRSIALLALPALLAPGCTRTPAADRNPSPSPSATSPSPSPSPVEAIFDAGRVLAHDRVLSVTIGSREATSPAYRRAAAYAAKTLSSFGYSVANQRVAVPSGKSQGVAVDAGVTLNVIATPPGYDPAKPHLVVGGHLDTVVPSPGGNDNGSGAAMILELARLASLQATRLPIVWVEFGAEERRRKGDAGATYGSRYYLAHLSAVERKSIRGMLAIDMVGNGPVAYVCHESLTGDGFVDALLASAKRLKLSAQKRIVVGLFSDHGPFEHAGYVVGWLWSGNHPTLHTPKDTFSIVQRSSIDRIGRIAWDTLRTIRL
jgi:Zn-dependent M28 family amino/carboxypeptidase